MNTNTFLGQRLRDAKIGTTSLVHLASKAHITKTCDCDTSTSLSQRSTLPDDWTFPTASSASATDPTLDFLDFLDMDMNVDIDIDFTALPMLAVNSQPQQHTLPLPSPTNSPAPPLTVFSALYINGSILGLSCSICVTSRSPFPLPSHPLPLHPTELQMQVAHPRWYDRLPFPRMRDSLIKLQGVVNEEELLQDFFTMPSFVIETGEKRGAGWESASWDPRAWKMEEVWRVKWGWLMC